ncbi:MAG: DNA mismatch repair protein MutS, partial [Flavobacteriales bacterium]
VVKYLINNPTLKTRIAESIDSIGDLERLASKISTSRINPREIIQLKTALQNIEPIKKACEKTECDELKEMVELLDFCPTIRERIENEIADDPPIAVNKGSVIKDGINKELDEYRRLTNSSKDFMLDIQQREMENTGISSLKV